MAKEAMVSSKTPKEITLAQLEETEKGSVFVINMSPRGYRGEIMFSAPKLNGNGADVVRIAKSWIPQDLTLQVTKQQLMMSSEFRGTVNKGLIRLLNPKYAEQILALDDARAEAEKLANERNAARSILRTAQLNEERDEKEIEREKTPTQRRREENQRKAEEDVTARAMETQFEAFLNTLDGKNETEVMNALKGEGGFTRKELRQIKDRFGEFPRIVRWIEKRLEVEED